MSDAIGQAVDAVADGAAIDWSALRGRARSDAERAELTWLQVLGDIAGVHRSTRDDPDPATSTPTMAAEAGAAASPGTWGRYRLVRRIGAGSYGSVYSAWDPELERHVAIKILRDPVVDHRVKEQLLREGRALARVTHDNVVRVFGIEAHEDRVGLCMELVSGETLEDVLQGHGLLSAREAALVGEDVCRALAAVHRAGYLHRDVKARNVMRDQAGRIVLMDFGTGHDTAAAGQRPAGFAGTPVYMAPEVLAGQPASAQSDVYSIGVLLYHLVTARYPVEGATLPDLVEAHRAGRVSPLVGRRPDLPVTFVQVVSRALSPLPAERWASAGAMLEALARLRDDAAPDPGPAWGTVARAVGGVAGGVAGVTALGMLNSRYFNMVLGREGFADEGPVDWLYWGARSLVAPSVLVLMALVALAVAGVAGRTLLGVWPGGRRLQHRLQLGARHLGLGEVGTAASWALVASVGVLVGACWLVSSQLGALTGIVENIGMAPLEQIAFFSPRYASAHNAYRATLSAVLIICAALWYWPVRLAVAQGESIGTGLAVAAAAVFILTVGLLDFPYRLLYQANFDSVQWQGQSCYVLGERGSDYLVFCPELEPPRNRTVSKDADDLQRVGAKVTIFSDPSITKADPP